MSGRRLQRASPEGLLFGAGGIVLAAASFWWAAVQGGLVAGDADVPVAVGHAVTMVFGVFPLFFAGFMFGPALKWLKLPALPARALAPAAAVHAAGALLLLGGSRSGFVAGLLAIVLSWAWLWTRLPVVLRAAEPSRRVHHRRFALVSALGLLGACATAVAAGLGAWGVCLALARAGVWCFVGLTFVVAAERMIPFLSGLPFDRVDRRWPALLPTALAVLFAGQGLAELMPSLQPVVGAAHLAAGVALLGVAARWRAVQSLRPALLRMLFVAFVWLGVSLCLNGVAAWWSMPWGSAPLHAFTVGFLGTTMLTMLSRFAAARAGRHDVADRVLWALFLTLQCAAVLRVSAPVLDAIGVQPASTFALSAALWGLVWLAWSFRYGALKGRRGD